MSSSGTVSLLSRKANSPEGLERTSKADQDHSAYIYQRNNTVTEACKSMHTIPSNTSYTSHGFCWGRFFMLNIIVILDFVSS